MSVIDKMEKAKQVLLDFINREYDHNDTELEGYPDRIPVMFSFIGDDDQYAVQMYVDLVQCREILEVNEQYEKEWRFDSLDHLIEQYEMCDFQDVYGQVDRYMYYKYAHCDEYPMLNDFEEEEEC